MGNRRKRDVKMKITRIKGIEGSKILVIQQVVIKNRIAYLVGSSGQSNPSEIKNIWDFTIQIKKFNNVILLQLQRNLNWILKHISKSKPY